MGDGVTCNDVPHWLDANLKSALRYIWTKIRNYFDILKSYIWTSSDNYRPVSFLMNMLRIFNVSSCWCNFLFCLTLSDNTSKWHWAACGEWQVNSINHLERVHSRQKQIMFPYLIYFTVTSAVTKTRGITQLNYLLVIFSNGIFTYKLRKIMLHLAQKYDDIVESDHFMV